MNNKKRRQLITRAKWIVASVGCTALAILVCAGQEPDESRTGIDRYTGIVLKCGAALSAFIAGGIGGWAPITNALVGVMAMDYITGVIVGIAGKSKKTSDGKLSSKVGFIGLAKKGFILAVVALAHMIDTGAGMGTNMVRDLACGWYIGNEGLSIYENMKLLGVPFPAPLKKVLEKIKKTGELPKPLEDKESEGGNS